MAKQKRKAVKERVEPRLFAAKPAPAQRRQKPRRRRRSFTGALFRLGFILCLWGTLVTAGLFGYVYLSLDQKGLFKVPDREPGIMVLAADGTQLAEQGSFFGDQARLEELPDYVPNAIISIEDRRFYSHFGVDPLGLIRAAYTNYRAGSVVQGGSTLTQQLAKNLFLSQDRTYNRKLQEFVLAVWLETHYTKDEILQLYLNRVYFGSGATGIEKAAQVYYNKSASELSIGEAATLAGLLKAPSNYNPRTNPESAAQRTKLVLASMVETGAISEADAKDALDQRNAHLASDYVPAKQYVIDWLNEQLPLLVKDYKQSIIIETTIDAALQTQAEKALRQKFAAGGEKFGVSQAALVVLDPNGAVQAMVGGRSYKRSQFNRATKALRQPGSAFKPFVFLTAIEQGFREDSVEVDEPIRIGDWQPENYKHKYMGQVTLRTALAYSLNTVAVKLTTFLGPEAVVETAHRLGITSPLGKDASIALGTSEVSLLELTSAFVPFANGGTAVQPFAITRITTRDGKLLYQRQGDGLGRVIDSYDLGQMNDMMRAVVTEGTGRKAAFEGFDIAGKTGTSQNYRDAWFIGYTTHLVTGVWAGNDDNSPAKAMTGGSLPAEIFHDVMDFAHAGLDPQPLPGDHDAYVADIAPPQSYDDGAAPRRESRGNFFDDLGSLFGIGGRHHDSAPRNNGGANSSIFQRMERRQQEGK